MTEPGATPPGPGAPKGGWFAYSGRPPGPLDHERGQQVPLQLVLVRNDDTAIWLTDFAAFTHGVRFTLFARRRIPVDGVETSLDDIPRPGRRRWPVALDRLLLLGVEFPDGRTATNVPNRAPGPPPWEPSDDSRPTLTTRGGGSGNLSIEQTYWLTPVPPDGPVTFVCRWEAAGVDEVKIPVPDAGFTTASKRAEVLWPEPPRPGPEPAPPEPPLPTTGWFGEALRHRAQRDAQSRE